MRLLADATMAVKLRLKSRITNLCASILLLNWSVWRFSRLYLGGWYRCGGNSLAAGRRWVQSLRSEHKTLNEAHYNGSCGYSSGFPTWWDTGILPSFGLPFANHFRFYSTYPQSIVLTWFSSFFINIKEQPLAIGYEMFHSDLCNVNCSNIQL